MLRPGRRQRREPAAGRPASFRMTRSDRVWLGLDSPQNLMLVTAVLEFGGRLDDQRLRAVLADRLLAAYPRFGQRVQPGRWPLRPARWVATEVDLDHHLQRVPLDGETLPAAVQHLLSRPLDLSRPPWRSRVLTGPAGDAWVVQLHHCIADGIALAGVLLALTDGAVRDGPGRAVRSSPAGAPAPVASTARLLAGMAGSAARLLLLPSEPRTALRGRLGIAKRAAWTPGLPLAEVRAVANATGGSINDVLLALTAGALRRYLLEEGSEPADLRAFVPVNVRPAGAGDSLGNSFGLVFPRLPVAQADPVRRVAATADRMSALKGTAEGVTTHQLINLLGLLPGWTQSLAGRVLGTKATAVVTNVPGPREPVSLAGAEVTRLTYWVPQVGSIGVGISVFSYAGTVSVGVATDAGVVPEPDRLTDAVMAEFVELRRAVR